MPPYASRLESPPAPPLRPAHRPWRRANRRAARVEDAARRLRDLLRCQIFSGSYPSHFLPSENELMETFGVQRAAVRQSLAMLRSEGVVERLQGIGTFAVRDRFVARLSEIHGQKENGGWLEEERLRPDTLDQTVVPAPDFVVEKLGLGPGENVLRLEYVSCFDGAPHAIATNYVAFPEAEAVDGTPFRTDWYQLLRDSGLTIGSSEWVLGCLNADPSVAALLEVPPGAAVMLGEQVICDDTGRPYDFAVCYIRTDRYAFSTRATDVEVHRSPAPLLSLDQS
jgi:GntR family transcriptional regulator